MPPRLQVDPRHETLLRAVGETAARDGLRAYLVGGVVRDLIMGRVSPDLDITVEGDGIAFAERLAGERGGRVKRHRRFGTAVLVLPGGVKLDVATARRESYPHPGALPDVEAGSLREDLYRRDFTMNSMALALGPARFGELQDPFGGERDIHARTIRVLHEGSFLDDPTRLYRAVRFAERLGFEVEPETSRLLTEAVGRGAVATVSGDRIRQELVLMLAEPEARTALAALRGFGLFTAIHPAFEVREREIALAAGLRAPTARTLHLERMLALTSGLEADAAHAVAARLGLAGLFLEWLGAWERVRREALPQLAREGEMPASELHRLLEGYPAAPLRLLMETAESELARARIRRYLEELRGTRTLVRGNDLAALGIPPGPGYGRLLRRLLDARLDGEVRTRAEELSLLHRMLRERTGGS